jgi:PPOX class probable F420-dependent enzyme
MRRVDELSGFLDASPPLVGIVATLRRSGAPHAVPVWYRWDGSAITIWSDDERAWVRNARRDPRVAFTVASSEPPYPAAVFHGRAVLVEGEQEPILAEVERIVARYLAEEEIHPFVGRYPGPHLIVRIEPDLVHRWSDSVGIDSG